MGLPSPKASDSVFKKSAYFLNILGKNCILWLKILSILMIKLARDPSVLKNCIFILRMSMYYKYTCTAKQSKTPLL